jgi:hypothetical protein
VGDESSSKSATMQETSGKPAEQQGGDAGRAEHPPDRSRGILSDIRMFLLHRPELPTRIKFSTAGQRENYSQRVMQRLGTAVEEYSVLNIHQIGVEAPARYVFEELMEWNGDSTCWPNHIATVHRKDGRLENIEILLFGRKRYLPGLSDGFFCLREAPLFDLNAIRIQRSPDPAGGDNARYLLYACSGGYPIGIFSMYARSSIPEQREPGQTQLFVVVGFDFYGEKRRPIHRLVGPLWEMVHNRVTANVLNRLKQLCEWRFRKLQQKL